MLYHLLKIYIGAIAEGKTLIALLVGLLYLHTVRHKIVTVPVGHPTISPIDASLWRDVSPADVEVLVLVCGP
jgi:hypothetical protein